MKFLLITFYVFSYLITNEYFNSNKLFIDFLILHILSFIFSFYILKILSTKDSTSNIIFYLVYIILMIGYEFKFYLFIYLFTNDNDSIRNMQFIFRFVSDSSVLIKTKQIITIALFSLFLLTKFCNNIVPISLETMLKRSFDVNKIFLLFIFIVICSVVTGFMQKLLGIEFTGKELPFFLSSIIIYSRNFLIPIIYLEILIITYFNFRRNKVFINFIIIAMIIHSLASTILMSSKGYLIVLIMQLVLLITSLKDINKYIIFIKASPFIIIAFLLYPIMELYRQFRVTYEVISIFDTIIGAYNLLIDTDAVLFLTTGILMIALRVIGTDSLIQAVNYTKSVVYNLDWTFNIINDDKSFLQFFTQDVAGFGAAAIQAHSSSPGILGYLYILFPNLILLFFTFLALVYTLNFIYIKLLKSNIRCKTLFYIYYCFVSLTLLVEGNLKFFFIQIIILLFIVLFIDSLFYRFNFLLKSR